MFEFYNPNPLKNTTGDCTIRALSKALDLDWDKTYCLLSSYGFALKCMPSTNRVWGAMAYDKGFRRYIPEGECTVAEFAESHRDGVYLLALENHVVCCREGCYFDSWDSGAEEILYYWQKEK